MRKLKVTILKNFVFYQKLFEPPQSSRKPPHLTFLMYRFQNSTTVRDNDLKFDIVIVFGNWEDPMQVFLPGIVHKLRQFMPIFFYSSKGLLLRFQSPRLLKESPKVKNEHFISFYLYFELLKKQRHFWTLPGRRMFTGSSHSFESP